MLCQELHGETGDIFEMFWTSVQCMLTPKDYYRHLCGTPCSRRSRDMIANTMFLFRGAFMIVIEQKLISDYFSFFLLRKMLSKIRMPQLNWKKINKSILLLCVKNIKLICCFRHFINEYMSRPPFQRWVSFQFVFVCDWIHWFWSRIFIEYVMKMYERYLVGW